MAEYYCDISAVGNEYQAYADTPVWGALSTDKPLPMDGTGLAGPGHSAAVAIAEFQITVLPADGNTIAIAGATLTAKTTAIAKNQWNIGASIATCITNLVALLNTFGTGTAQCDAATATGACKLLLALPYWQYARVKPGTTDTIQIATRFAGADLNHASNSSVAITSAGWATPPTITQFAGGANGPFAYLYNNTTIFGKTYLTYGIWFAIAPGPTEPTATADVVHCRSMRSSVNLTCSVVQIAVNGNWRSRAYLFDDGTTWSGDNGKLIAVFWCTNVNSSAMYFNVPTGLSGGVILSSRSKYNLEIQCYAIPNSSVGFASIATSTSRFVFNRCRFVEHASSSGSSMTIVNSIGNYNDVLVDVSDSFYQVKGSLSAGRSPVNLSNQHAGTSVRANGLVVEIVAATGPIAPALYVPSASSGGLVEWIGGEIKDTLGVYSCAMPFSVATTATAMNLVCDGVAGVTNPSVGFSVNALRRSSLWWNQPEGSSRGFRYETNRYVVDWRGNGTFPHCGVTNLQGDSWAHRVTWNDGSPLHSESVPIRTSFFYRAAAAVKTLTLELYVPDATVFYLDQLRMDVSYVDSTGVIRNETYGNSKLLQMLASRNAIASSAKSWTANGVASFSAKKISLTTAAAIKQNSEIMVSLVLCASRASPIVFYVSPELGVP